MCPSAIPKARTAARFSSTASFVRDRLFRPFDTTKGDTGMGIGAFESREFVRNLGGDIKVTSTPGAGSMFRVVLPRVGENEEPIMTNRVTAEGNTA